ncbi:acetyl-CoA carboxylase carboxyltransferase subunit alpha [Carboxydochorda subterranea]|uniref:Acetyl-coenzyme A carboxylase carboxyl transferase subunit alpha n=1 Tax=Carboxydichorda subterranea TaxID=3109565 RepID=A0ABZ1BUK6_9FIRM|nr:acetyl-CoA carboxylase carboxyltransferase subunit alpha [Limnochorda sp. L945t]WRP16305.1 acetyl-CoA carboxylase carboxyltransferase subunit alpha [Limnochorda sp. L945t]
MPSNGVFEWERPLVELERRLAELKAFSSERGMELHQEIAFLERRAQRLREEIYRNLTPWQRVMMARHSGRPTFLDYVALLFEDFVELHGDRKAGDDGALVGGVARFDGRPVTLIGTQKGRDTKENLQRNFGLPHPEGYRKALRLMKQAEKFGRPIISFVDVVGAFPGIEAEQRGQGVAIAENIMAMAALRTPIVVIVTGEGGSGGALAIGVGDRVYMLEHAWYSVISPEMCATILWRDSSRAAEAAAILKLTAQDLLRFGVIDGVIPEPPGGAHRDRARTAEAIRSVLREALEELGRLSVDALVEQRFRRYRNMGVWGATEQPEPASAPAEARQQEPRREPVAVTSSGEAGGAPGFASPERGSAGPAEGGAAGGGDPQEERSGQRGRRGGRRGAAPAQDAGESSEQAR